MILAIVGVFLAGMTAGGFMGARLREAAERALLPASPVSVGNPAAFEPPVNVWESEGEVTVEAELPGARSQDIDLRLEGDTLVVAGELAIGERRGGGDVPARRAAAREVLPCGRAPGRSFRQDGGDAPGRGSAGHPPKAGRSRRRVAIAGEGV